MAFQINSQELYETAYNIEFNWEKWLPKEVFDFHRLNFEEYNSPVELQMGVLLPFIASLCGPKMKSKFSTRKSACNIFWVNVAASGVGKTQSRKRMISEPLKYLIQNVDRNMFDFEVSKFTRAGIEDKLISTDGYCCIVTDEGSGFFDDIKRKESKHESDLGLLNQLYDGEGDKTTLAQNKERVVPKNSTCMTIGIQPEAFINGLNNLGQSNWNFLGFGERFIVTAARPYRFNSIQNEKAAEELSSKFTEDFLGQLVLEIFKLHESEERVYQYTPEAKRRYHDIVDKYNELFNRKYGTGEPTPSQNELDYFDKAEIKVRTKATELIGRLSVVLWIYCQGFRCIRENRPFHIPLTVEENYVKFAEEIVNVSYAHSETFSSAIFNSDSPGGINFKKPDKTDRNRVVYSICKSPGPIIYIRQIAKNIKHMTTKQVRDEVTLLEEEGFGILVTKEKMVEDKCLPYKWACNVYCKPDISYLDNKFYNMAADKEINDNLYLANYRKPIDNKLTYLAHKYHPHKDLIALSQVSEDYLKELKTNYGISQESQEENSSYMNSFPLVRNPKVFTVDTRKNTSNSSLEHNEEVNPNSPATSTKKNPIVTSMVLPDSTSEDDLNYVELKTASDQNIVIPKSSSETHDSEDDSNSKLLPNKGEKSSSVYYTKSTKGRKYNPQKKPVDADNNNTKLTKSDNFSNVTVRKIQSTLQKDFEFVDYLKSTDSESDVDKHAASCPLPQGTVKKTTRWHREKPKIPKCKDTDFLGLRKSQRLKDIRESKKKEEENQSTDSTEGKNQRGRKRKLSASKRNQLRTTNPAKKTKKPNNK